MKNFRDLKVWQKAHSVTLDVYKASAKFPKDEMYALTSQMRRVSSSISANIAEGCGRGSDADFGRFLQIAMGSASELEYHLLLACDLKFLNQLLYKKFNEDVTGVKRMLASFLKKLKANR